MKFGLGRVLLTGILGLCALTSLSGQETVVAPLPGDVPGGLLPSLTTPQFARLSNDGRLSGNVNRLGRDGTIRSIPNLEVSLIAGGKILTRVLTTPEGDFTFAQVRPGFYTIVASNPKDLLVYPLTVAENDGTEAEPVMLVAASSISPNRRQSMLAAVLGYPGDLGMGTSASIPDSRRIADTYEVSITADGQLRGRLGVLGTPMSQVDMSSMIVRVMREDSVIGESPVAPDGSFAIPGVSPGPVSFFAFGPRGFVAIGLKLTSALRVGVNLSNKSETLVAAQQPTVNLNIEVAPIPDVLAGVSIPGDSFSLPNNALPPAGTGAFGGPGGGFGGGGAGGGGFGAEGLLGLGAAGLAAAALSSDDNNNNFVPAPASPAQLP